MSPQPASGRRYRLFHNAQKLAPLLSPDHLLGALDAAGQWLETASNATGETGLCYRTALYDADGSVSWHYPHSNTSELIGAWLDLAEVFPDGPYRARALAYAERYVSDPVYGLYRGDKSEGHGLAWYWRDDQTYTGGYSMRAPEVLQRLTRMTGEDRWLEASNLIGETFLRRQLENGIVHMVGWSPEKGWGHPNLIGSRYAYTVGTFASLFDQTHDPRYRAAYEKSVLALQTMQQPDGSFFQNYHPETLAIPEPSIKPHFFSYLFNGMMEAWRVFRDERILESARKLAGYIAGEFYYRQMIPYCLFPHWSTDHAEADTGIHDCARGFLWLHEVTGETEWLDIGTKLWVQALLTQVDAPELPHVHGAVIRGVRPDLETAENVTRSKDPSHAHLQYAPDRVGRCEIWFQTHFIFAGVQLLRRASV